MIDLGVHALAIKDMAGLLKPRAARPLVEAIRAGAGDALPPRCAGEGGGVVDAAG